MKWEILRLEHISNPIARAYWASVPPPLHHQGTLMSLPYLRLTLCGSCRLLLSSPRNSKYFKWYMRLKIEISVGSHNLKFVAIADFEGVGQPLPFSCYCKSSFIYFSGGKWNNKKMANVDLLLQNQR